MKRYYATAVNAGRCVVLAGPFACHRDARAASDHARRRLSPHMSHRERFGTGWGTASAVEPLTPRFNDQLGLDMVDGLVVCKPGGVWRVERRRRSRAVLRRRALVRHARRLCGWCGRPVPPGCRQLNLNSTVPSFCDDGCRRAAW